MNKPKKPRTTRYQPKYVCRNDYDELDGAILALLAEESRNTLDIAFALNVESKIAYRRLSALRSLELIHHTIPAPIRSRRQPSMWHLGEAPEGHVTPPRRASPRKPVPRFVDDMMLAWIPRAGAELREH